MTDRTKIIRPKLRTVESITELEAKSILELITPNARTFMCRRNGRLVDGGFCAFFCDLGKQRKVNFDPGDGIEVTCPFAYNEILGQTSGSALADS